jgi:class 3 adenylate cyclase
MTYERACASPGAVRDILRFIRDIDVRAVLPAIQCPTLVLHRTGDLPVAVEHGRYLADHIPGARLVELPGWDHMPWVGDTDALLNEIEEFITGERSVRVEVDRVLATVVFTDIVGSTARAGELGDQRWRTLLDRHDAAVRRELARHGGREVKATGDGFLATFESPSRGVRAAIAMGEAARTLGLEIRAGVHTGEIERRGADVSGVGVHVGARISALAGPSEVLVSSTVRDLVLGSDFTFADRGRHTLKGVAGDWQLLAVNQ